MPHPAGGHRHRRPVFHRRHDLLHGSRGVVLSAAVDSVRRQRDGNDSVGENIVQPAPLLLYLEAVQGEAESDRTRGKATDHQL